MVAAVRIAVDGMGGDFGPRLAFEACCNFLQRQSGAQIELFVIDSFVAPFACPDGLQLVHCPLAVLPADNPAQVLRHKQASSMGQALMRLRDGNAQAFLSAGNTGGLVMLAAHLLEASPGVSRPVLCTSVPTSQGVTWLLDLGGVLSPDAGRLVEYARLGAQQASRMLKRKVRVALLNLGQEDEKGTPEVKAAAQCLKNSSEFDYVGFVEPAGLFAGVADVVVCDGLVGNMVLKSAEAAASTVLNLLCREFSATIWRKLLGWFSRGVFTRVREQLHPAGLNGALLLGVEGVVVKSHGGADQEGFLAALNMAYRAVKFD